MRKCGKCGTAKPLSEFHKHKDRKDGVATTCKSCVSEYSRKHYLGRRDEGAAHRKSLWEQDKKIREGAQEAGEVTFTSVQTCKRNHEDKARYTRNGLCRACCLLRTREAQKKTSKYILRAKSKRRYHNRLKRDPDFLCSSACRSMVRRVLSLEGKSKNERTSKILGYSAVELREHIERQFLKGMNWDNRSDWHIDHITPIAEFIREGIRDPAVINALPNLRPMWAKENLEKGDKLLTLI